MLYRRVTATVAAFALIAALAGCGSSSSSSGVTAAAYVKAICSAVGPFEKDVQTRSQALSQSTLTQPAEGKKALQSFLAAIVADSDKALSQLKAAGTPQVANGAKIEAALTQAFSRLKTALSAAASKADALPTNSPTAFKTGAQALGTSVQSSMTAIGTGLNLKSPELEKAAKAEPVCTTLSGG